MSVWKCEWCGNAREDYDPGIKYCSDECEDMARYQIEKAEEEQRAKNTPRMEESGWEEFQKAGMLWFVNRLLHVFGWSIVLQCEDDGTVSRAWPSRTEWKGFSPDAEEAGYEAVEAWLKKMFGAGGD